MKRLVIAFSLLGAAVLGCVTMIVYTREYALNSEQRLIAIYYAPEKEAEKLLAAFAEEWESKHEILGTFIEETPLERADDSLKRAAALLREGKQEEFKAEIWQTAGLFAEIYRHELPTPENVL